MRTEFPKKLCSFLNSFGLIGQRWTVASHDREMTAASNHQINLQSQLVGPDPHSYHIGSPEQFGATRIRVGLAYMNSFFNYSRGVLDAYAYHEYIRVYNGRDATNSTVLDRSYYSARQALQSRQVRQRRRSPWLVMCYVARQGRTFCPNFHLRIMAIPRGRSCGSVRRLTRIGAAHLLGAATARQCGSWMRWGSRRL